MPSTMASADATLLIATRRLATYFMRLPLPNAPRSCSPRENAANSGRSRLIACGRRSHRRRCPCVFACAAGAADRAVEHHVAGLRQARARPCVLSSSVKVLISTTTRGLLFASMIAATVASSAAGLRQAGDDDRCRGGERRRILRDLDAGARERAAARLRRCRSRSTRQPAAARCLANAPPMMPRPTMPTVPFAAMILLLRCNRRRTRTTRISAWSKLFFRGEASPIVASRKSMMEHQSMNIGIAGLGRMGAAIAQRLMEVGHQVTVWNRSAEKTKPLAAAGAAVAATPAELAARVRDHHHHPHRRRGDRCGLWRAVRAARRRRQAASCSSR